MTTQAKTQPPPATVRARWTSEAAGDIAVAVASVIHQARIATNPVVRSQMVGIAREQWRSALRYERSLVAFGQRMLAEQEQSNDRVIAESTRPGETERAAEQRAVCNHPRLSVYVSYRSTFDDHTVSHGWCPECDSFAVVTDFVDGRAESRPMSCAELELHARRETTRQRSEWLDDARCAR